SPDGVTWTARSSGLTLGLWGIAYGGGIVGYRIAPALDLSPVRTAAAPAFSWTATTPAGPAVTVETSLDGGQPRQPATHGGPTPRITAGMDLTGKSLLVRQVLMTLYPAVTPVLGSLSVRVESVATHPEIEWAPLGTFWS